MSNSLAQKITLKSLLVFSLPTIIMMVFISIYSMVDGIFVSQLISTDALAAVNIVFPIPCIIMAVGIMLSTGISAIIARKMGEGKTREAKENFTLVIIIGIIVGIAMTTLGLIFAEPLLRLLGAAGDIYPLAKAYLLPFLWFIPANVLQLLFQMLFVTAGKPGLGLATTISGGLANIVLDYVFIKPLQMGIAGAAIATGIGFCIPAVFGLIYFSVKQKGTLSFVRPKWDGKVLLKTCINGSSEMVTNLASAITTYLFNITMLRLLGSDGVAAITIVLYAQFLLTAVFLGYSSGVAPLISYNYGNKDIPQQQKIFKISLRFIIITSLLMLGVAIFGGQYITLIFTTRGSLVFDYALHGFYLFAISFLFMGINIFASSLFTALNNGKISALISFLRTFVFIVGAILLLPLIFNVDGVWLAIPIAELLGIIVSIVCIVKMRKTYQYY